jgi:Leucine-rich repeat (LRR) protein
MHTDETPQVPTPEQSKEALSWWNTLSDAWKCAFNETMLRRTTTDCPEEQDVFNIYQCQTLRLAGPTAPYPNMTFELEDLSGLKGLPNVNIVIVTFHKLVSLAELSGLKQITSLFLHNNQITSLAGIEDLENLGEIYFNVNQVTSLLPLSHLTNLHTVYCNYNRLTSLEGIGEQHRPKLKNFICLPNDSIAESEVINMERDLGIRCKKG